MATRIKTRQLILEAAIRSFGTQGYEAVSLSELAAELDITKQAILYHFGSKEGLLTAAIDDSVKRLALALDNSVGKSQGVGAVEEVVRAVFRMAIRNPEVLGILREVMRLGEPWSSRVREKLEPLVLRAQGFLEAEMKKGRIRKCNVRLLLISSYSTVMGVATEVEVLRALGVEPTLKETVIRRRELLGFLRSALR